MVKLQLALDLMSLEDAMTLVEKLKHCVDIVEIGTPFVMKYGCDAVRRFKKTFPDLEVLCDCKIMDAGSEETEMMVSSGADWVTVMAVTNDSTIVESVATAHAKGAKVMVDLLCYEITAESTERLIKCGADCLAVHVGVDQQAQGETPLVSLRKLKDCNPSCMVAVAGGISESNIEKYLQLEPNIVIVGSGITEQKNPVAIASRIREKIDQFKKGKR